jgi:hypothetical protein
VAKHLHVEPVSAYVHRVAHGLLDPHVHGCREGDLGHGAGLRVHPPHPSLCPDHHVIRIRHPREPGLRTMDRPRLLHVVLQTIPNGPLFARFEIAHEQHRGFAHPADERQTTTVRMGRRRDGSTGATGHGLLLSRFQVPATNGVDPGVRILVVLEQRPGRDVLAVVDPPTVRAHGWLTLVLLFVGAVRHLEPGAPGAVPHPDFPSAEGAREDEVFPSEDGLSVGRPGRGVHVPLSLIGHLLQIVTRGGHRPDVVEPPTVAHERDTASRG